MVGEAAGREYYQACYFYPGLEEALGGAVTLLRTHSP